MSLTALHSMIVIYGYAVNFNKTNQLVVDLIKLRKTPSRIYELRIAPGQNFNSLTELDKVTLIFVLVGSSVSFF